MSEAAQSPISFVPLASSLPSISLSPRGEAISMRSSFREELQARRMRQIVNFGLSSGTTAQESDWVTSFRVVPDDDGAFRVRWLSAIGVTASK